MFLLSEQKILHAEGVAANLRLVPRIVDDVVDNINFPVREHDPSGVAGIGKRRTVIIHRKNPDCRFGTAPGKHGFPVGQTGKQILRLGAVPAQTAMITAKQITVGTA